MRRRHLHGCCLVGAISFLAQKQQQRMIVKKKRSHILCGAVWQRRKYTAAGVPKSPELTIYYRDTSRVSTGQLCAIRLIKPQSARLVGAVLVSFRSAGKRMELSLLLPLLLGPRGSMVGFFRLCGCATGRWRRASEGGEIGRQGTHTATDRQHSLALPIDRQQKQCLS